MRVVLMRTGTVLQADNANASPVAGNQDALGILRYLLDSEHEVCVFGPSRGDFPCEVFNISTTGLDEYDVWDTFKERFQPSIDALREWAPDVCVNVCGATPTVSCEDNPFGIGTLSWCKRTVAPALIAIHQLKIPRICVVNDPRNFAKDHEMLYWPEVRPAAFLSQGNYTFNRRVRGNATVVTGVDAHAENWWSYGMEVSPPGGVGEMIMAHSHFKDSRAGKERPALWQQIIAAYTGDSLSIYGKGWESYPELWKGCLKHTEVQGVLMNAQSGPMIPIQSFFNTGKLREYVIAGTLPRPVVSESHTYDAHEKYVPLAHHTRLKAGEPWKSMQDDDWVLELQAKTTPNFSVLEDAMHNWKDGRHGGIVGLSSARW